MVSQASRFPRQIKYIVGNEACERFSFYGMRSILVIFMIQHLTMQASESKSVFHLFVSASYFLPLLGGYLSDRFLGKYKTIMYLSVVYCLGHAVLAMWDTRLGLYWGLAIIAIGAGGIKPCVSAHVGDQFDNTNKDLLPKIFEIFYWSINFGAFFSSILIPKILPLYGPAWAFGIPGILMFIATYVFWLGRKYYVHVPPTGKAGGAQFFAVVSHAVLHLGEKQPGQHFLDTSIAKFGVERVDGAKAAVGIFKVFLLVSMFWALYDQTGSSWVLQAEQMNRDILGYHLESSQIQALNPILILLLIPFFSLFGYPAIERLGFKLTPLRKMSIGMFLAALSFLFVSILQTLIERGQTLSVGWQFIPFLAITASEVMISITGLEFAYTQSPRAMKSTIMSLWLLTISLGNLLTAVISYINPFQGAAEFFFYTGAMVVVSVGFIWMALRYQGRNYIEGNLSA